MSILEELWYGNIEPDEYDISPGKKYKEIAIDCSQRNIGVNKQKNLYHTNVQDLD